MCNTRLTHVNFAWQAQFCRERHDLLDELLRLLGAAVSCNPERQASIVAQPVGTDLLRVVLDCIGWAHHQGFNIPLPGAVKCLSPSARRVNFRLTLSMGTQPVCNAATLCCARTLRSCCFSVYYVNSCTFTQRTLIRLCKTGGARCALLTCFATLTTDTLFIKNAHGVF
eukprot:COSAG02_NODE_921_length_15917_cov_4.428057_3_plen_169_part_00